ncbi:APC family permease [Agromyces sp. SYSU K20354]|uniref:APC family permease n=1 Tax=Agromyces cavernae TaxID=2898659 RepID=UPI001E4E2F36|nr:APC family permease [Agromyces cavernae]MCD2443284.1 APC family permease [Agromyces cavernae]
MAQGSALRSNAVGLGGAVIMSAALMGPAVSVYFNPQVVAASAGAAMPLVFVIALVVMLVVASSIMAMAKAFPSAGSFYTYVSRGIGPRTGFVTGGLMFIAYALLVPAELALIGVYTQDVLAGYGIQVHWTIISAIFTVLMVVLSLRGISGSLRTAAILFCIEVGVIVLLSAIVLMQGGAAGLTLEPFSPAESPNGISGLALGMTFGILSFVGFEAATTLGEEVREPRRNVPRGILYSLLLVGAIYIFCTYAEMIGFGVSGLDSLVGNAAPFNELARTYAPWLDLLIGLAGISSIFAVTMNANNGVVRIIFAMGREGMLPSSLGRIHPVHRTPTTAIWLQAIVAVVFTFGVGLLAGPFNAYVYLGSILTLAIIPVYILTNIACMRHFAREGRAERNVWRHAVLPVLGIVLLGIPIYGQVYPVPAEPLRYFPYIVLAFIAAMAVIAVVFGRRRPEVLARAGAVLAGGESEVGGDEDASSEASSNAGAGATEQADAGTR